MKNSKVATINIRIKDLFKQWLEITKIFHNLRDQEINILALFLYNHYKLKKEITNEKILWKLVFDYDVKIEIEEELNIKGQSLRNVLTALRKKGIIQDGRISKMYIPEIEDKSDNFKIVFNFNIVNE